MKRIALFIMMLAAAGCAVAPTDLSTWTLRKEGEGKTWTVKVPCTVAGALMEAGEFGENILDEDHYKAVDPDYFDGTWIFSNTFGTESGRHHILRFGSLGYSADIILNGETLASADTTVGPFCVREFDITPLARRSNTLEVRVHRAPKQSLNHGYVDWNPRPFDETMGILRAVELISTPDVEVKDIFVKPLVDLSDLSKADLKVYTTLVNRSDSPVSGNLRGTYEDGLFEVPVSLAPGEEKVFSVDQHIDNPRIWWSRDLGTPEMYHMNVAFVSGGKISHESSTSFGIRDITSRITEEGHRQFVLNGRDILIKSAGWTDDIFMMDTPARTRKQVEMVADMGLNCIRFENIWGKDDTVYDACDSLGLLTFVGFSCQWEWEDYCGYKETKGFGCINSPEQEDLAVRYFHDQIIRLRNHPSLIAWLTGSDRIPNPGLEKRYMAIYDKEEYRPYVCSAKGITSSVTGPSGTKMEGPYEYVGPDYWYLDRKYGGAYGFNTETGIGTNMPQAESVRRMVGEDNLWPLNSVWDYHCTASASHMNNTSVIKATVDGLYGEADGFEDFIKKAHAADYDGTRAMYEAFRSNLPHSTGIVQWMLNSAWPSIYWQLYDWYLVPTAAYYGVKKACAPLQLVYNYGDHGVYAVNDVMPQTELVAGIRFYDTSCRKVRDEVKDITLSPRQHMKVFGDIKGPGFLFLSLTDRDGSVLATNAYCIGSRGFKYDWAATDWCSTPVTQYDNLDFVSALPSIVVSLDVNKVDRGYEILLDNNTETVSYQNILKAKDAEGNLIPGVLWSDNFITLAPGTGTVVRCTLPEGCESAEISLSGWNSKTE